MTRPRGRRCGGVLALGARVTLGRDGARSGAGGVDAFVRAARWPERPAIRALLAVGRRPRGAALLRRLPAADQLVRATLALGRYDDPAIARTLGWDAAAVAARGCALRRAERRPA